MSAGYGGAQDAASQAPAMAAAMDANQSLTPTTGQTVTLTDSTLDGTCFVNPAGTLATLTITLPSDGNSRINQERHIVLSRAITALTINGATTIVGNVLSAIANTWISAKKVAANTWVLRVTTS